MPNYVEVNGIVFTAINNIMNTYCYHLTVVQLFHASPTFNKCMMQFKSMNTDPFFKQMLEPFVIYADVNTNNYMDKYVQLKQSYNNLISTTVADFAKNGYSPFFVVYFYIFPILNHLFPNEVVKQIAEEISAQSIHFNTTRSFYTNIIVNNPFVKKEYEQLMLQLCEKMVNDLGNYTIKNKRFVAGILEVYPDAHTVDGGHALFLLYDGKGCFYIFDDDSTIELFDKYVKTRANNIHKICIHTSDEEAVNRLQQLWGKNILTKRVNNRYEIINRSPDEKSPNIKQIASSFIEVHEQQSKKEPVKDEFLLNTNMLGGDGTAPVKTYKKGFITCLILTILLTIVLIVESILAFANRKKAQTESFDCPCRKQRFGRLY